MALKQKVSTRLSDICDPLKVIAHIKDGEHVRVGTLIGVAQDTLEHTDKVGSKIEGLSGLFELTPSIADAEKGGKADTAKAGQLFLPPVFFEVINGTLQKVLYPDPNKPDKKARGSVEFALHVGVTRKSAKAFDWRMEPVIAPQATDPLAHLRRAFAQAQSEFAPAPVEPPKAAEPPKEQARAARK